MAGKGTIGSRIGSLLSRRRQLARNVALKSLHLLRDGLVYGFVLCASVTLSEPLICAVSMRLQMYNPTSFWIGHGFFTLLLFTLIYLLIMLMYNVFVLRPKLSMSRHGLVLKESRKTRSGKTYGYYV